MDEAKQELTHLRHLLERCAFFLKESGTVVEFSSTGRSVQQVIDNIVTRLAVVKEQLPIRVIQTVEHTTISLDEERFYKLGIMLTKIVQIASELEEELDA